MLFIVIIVVFVLVLMAGVFFLLGFVGKEFLYDVFYYVVDFFVIVYLVLLFLAGVFFMVVSVDILYNVFFKIGKFRD